MSSTRSVRPTDLVALVAFDGRVYPNEARTWERLGAPSETPSVLGSAAQQWLSFATGRHTWISIQGQTLQGLISARRRGARAAWEVDCLIAAVPDGEQVALSLFDRLSAGAVRSGAQKIFLRVEVGSEMLVPARKSGFVPYATEHLLRLDALPLLEPSLPPALMLRPRERPDEYALFQLYNRVTPAQVRVVEAASLSEWQAATERRSRGRGAADIVVEHDGRIVGWLRTAPNRAAGRLDMMVDPEQWPAADALIGWGLRDLGPSRPVYAAVPAYAGPVRERMLAAGFMQAGEYALLAKRLTQPVRAGRPVRATVKPVATV